LSKLPKEGEMSICLFLKNSLISRYYWTLQFRNE